jgi:general secretion pathway protein J
VKPGQEAREQGPESGDERPGHAESTHDCRFIVGSSKSTRAALDCTGPRPLTPGPRSLGFSLIELLVALVVFATMAALAYGGLNSVARTRSELARQQDAFRDLTRAIEKLNRDIGEAVARTIRDPSGNPLPALIGTADHIELTRVGFANPQAEPRSNLERVLFERDAGTLKRGRYLVLDRAPTTTPEITDLHVAVTDFRLRYLGGDNRWLDVWPPPQTDPAQLPRTIEWHVQTHDYDEIAGIVELVSAWPVQAAGAPSISGTIPPVTPPAGTSP